jgi:4-hydroxybenzoyl-CoA thioesterase
VGNVFHRTVPVRFAHCDAAGIMFYPRAFELVNGVVEDWFADGLGVSFRDLHLKQGLGFPLVKLEAVFQAPAVLGDALDFTLTASAIGRSSVDMAIAAATDGSPRFAVRSRGVFTRLDSGKSIPIPEGVRAAIDAYLRAS